MLTAHVQCYLLVFLGFSLCLSCNVSVLLLQGWWIPLFCTGILLDVCSVWQLQYFILKFCLSLPHVYLSLCLTIYLSLLSGHESACLCRKTNSLLKLLSGRFSSVFLDFQCSTKAWCIFCEARSSSNAFKSSTRKVYISGSLRSVWCSQWGRGT